MVSRNVLVNCNVIFSDVSVSYDRVGCNCNVIVIMYFN